MAKSIRSKWKRKCRAIKRERYGKKELERLKKTLGLDSKPSDVNMTEISQVANVRVNSEEIDAGAPRKTFSRKTLRDKNGAHPVWLHPRKITKKKKTKKVKRKGKKH